MATPVLLALYLMREMLRLNWLLKLSLSRRALAAAVLLIFSCTVGCGAGESEGHASCAAVIKFEGRTYTGATEVKFDTGDRLGTVRNEVCNDTGRGSDGVRMPDLSVYQVKGLDKTLAVAAGGKEDVKFYAVMHDNKWPAEVLRFIGPSRK